MQSLKAALGRITTRSHSPEGKRRASEEEAHNARIDPSSRTPDAKPLDKTQFDQPVLPRIEQPSAVDCILHAEAALADTDNGRYRNNKQFLDALEQLALAPRDRGDEATDSMLDDLRQKLEMPESDDRFVRFKPGELASYQKSLKALGWVDLSLKAGQLTLQRLNREFSAVRMDTYATDWLTAIEAGHAADLPAQSRIIGELQRFKRAIYDAADGGKPPRCAWRDFIKVVSMIPGMREQIQGVGPADVTLSDILVRGVDPIRARGAQELARKVEYFQEMAAMSQTEDDVLRMTFNFCCTKKNSAIVPTSRGSEHIRVTRGSPTYRVVCNDSRTVTAWLLNAEVEMQDAQDDGFLEYPVNAWRPQAATRPTPSGAPELSS